LRLAGTWEDSRPTFEENKNIPISISMITYAGLVFEAKRSQNEQKNMIKVNHIREIYP